MTSASTAGLAHFWAVVPAGGAGTRLWPLSRSAAPKFLRDLTGSGRTLLQETYDRLQPVVGGRCVVVTGEAHEASVRAQLPGLADDLLLTEPSGRDSMGAVGFAAAVLERRDPEAVMGSFAADHVITREDEFIAAVHTAAEVAADGWLVTIGINPTFPSTAFGYIREGAPLEGHPGVRVVDSFVEKPSMELAESYLAAGDYRWNAGIFVVRPTVLLDLLATWHPHFAATLRTIAAEPRRLRDLWEPLPGIALDNAVAEPAADAGRVATVSASFGWDDVGDFDSLATLLNQVVTAPPTGPTILGDTHLVHALDSTGLVVPHSGRHIALIGMEDVVVVDTPDAVLVITRAEAQRVKQVVARLKAADRHEII